MSRRAEWKPKVRTSSLTASTSARARRPAPTRLQVGAQQGEIVQQLAGAAVGRPVAPAGGAGGARQGREHPVDELPPRLVRVARRRQHVPAGAGVGGGQHRQALGQGGARRLQPVGQAEAGAEAGQVLADQVERHGAELRQRLAGDLAGDEGMAVAVAADPASELQVRQDGIAAVEKRRVEPGVPPGLAQPADQQRQHRGKDVAQVVEDVADLAGHVRPFDMDLSRPPQPLQHRLDLLADVGLLARRPHLVLPLDQQQVELAVVLEDRPPLGLGRMRRQHRLDPDRGQGLGDGVRLVPGGKQPAEGVLPRSRALAEGAGGGEPAVVLGVGVLLDHVEQGEGGGVGLRQPLGAVAFDGDVCRRGEPRQPRRDPVFALLAQDLAEAGHDEVEVTADLRHVPAPPPLMRTTWLRHCCIWAAAARFIPGSPTHQTSGRRAGPSKRTNSD